MSSELRKHSDRITTAQTAVILINYTLGASILIIPRMTVQAALVPDVWMSVIITGGLFFIAGMFSVWLCQRFKGKTLFEFVPEITGKWIGYVLGLIAVLYFVTVSAYELRMMIEVTSVYLLEGTPIWAVMMSFMWVSLYLNIGGINSIARLNEIVMPITLVFFIVCIISSTDIFDIHNLLPVLGSGFKPVLQGIMPTLPAFMGFEILLIIIAFMKAPEKGMNALRFGIWIPVLINVITVVFVIGGLGIYATANTTFPTLTLVRSYEYPGLIFERFESLMLVIWIMQMFTSFSITHYAASLGCSAMFKPKRTSIMFVLLPLIYLLSMTPKDLLEVVAVGNFLGIFSLTLFGGVPPILLLISILRKKGKSRT